MVKFSSPFPCFPSAMDGNSSDNSHSCSEIGGGGWIPTWEHELSSLSGLTLGLGLTGLVDDKEIAARAVAFVVNSTRKGIVPLCADIASLLRSKQCLEKKILMLRNENEMLRSSASGSVRTSQSASPIPASLNSYNDKTMYPDDSLQNGDHSRPCSRCSQCSSNLSTSPKLEKGEGFMTSDLEAELPSGGVPGQGEITSTPTKQENGLITEVVVHTKQSENGKLHEASISRSSSGNTPPEITAVPNGDVRKIRPAGKMISRETQCSFSRKRDHAAETKKEPEKQNHSKEKNLADDLGEARKEIELLKARLKDLEMAQNKDVSYHVENEVSQRSTLIKSESQQSPSKSEQLKPTLNTSEASPVKPEKSITQTGSTKPKPMPKQLRLTSISQPLNPDENPVRVIPGCKCSLCQKAAGETTGLSPFPKTKSKIENHKIRINSKLEVKIGDHVLSKDESSGYVQYIGHVDNSGDKNRVYVGLSLDATGGENDGFIYGKRYFLCQRDRGIFLPVDDIVCSLPSKEARKPVASPLSDVTLAADLDLKSDGKSHSKSSKKASSGSSTQAKLGERLTLMLQKSRKVSDKNPNNPALTVSKTDKKDGPISTSSPTEQSPRNEKRWIAPYTEITRTPREGPVV